MKEEEWLKGNKPAKMLRCNRLKNLDRKFRLFSCACCRRIWNLLPDKASQLAVETAERFADGQATRSEMLDVVAKLKPQSYTDTSWRAGKAAWYTVTDILQSDAAYHTANQTAEADPASGEEIREWLAEIIRDIFGNPFRPVTFLPEWRTSTVLSLAQGIYSERAFDRMPILADALMDAGCSEEDILNHCRGPGPHVRGCFVVDLVTGRG
jgi:hypothetical protein